ncbi:aminoglycoside phosphotransferase family protein [Pseudonocardia petroleophila]|uniref:aminoglycoside phosphotransferase family protein n=1 Tax=Pseudonocardia petroleophila TaxID=37331 RepID=UPI002107914C|nr:aminoglycoside phosphotransferase family protein [Pseudonocardia petroleophila]
MTRRAATWSSRSAGGTPRDGTRPTACGPWSGRGAVAVHASWAQGSTIALLLERARHGTPLRDARPLPEQDEIVAAALRALWRPAGAPFRPLAQVCDLWADEVEPLLTADVLDPGLVRDGLALHRALPRADLEPVLLVSDLHAGNLLAAAGGTWRPIDPQPYLGDPCFDVLQHILNDRRVADDAGAVADRMAGLTGLDAGRVRTWLFARSVVESAWSPWIWPVAAALAP